MEELPPGGTIETPSPAGLPVGGTISSGHVAGLPPGGQIASPIEGLPPGGDLSTDLLSPHPATGLPMFQHLANEEINATNAYSPQEKMQIAQKWQQAAEAQRTPANPHFLGIDENLGTGPGNAIQNSVTDNALSVAGLVAPQTAAELKQGAALSYPYDPNFVNNAAAGLGGALVAAPVAMTTGGAGMAVLGGVQGAGGARIEAAQKRAAGQQVSAGQEFAGAALQGAMGAGQGYLQGKLMGGAGELAGGIANPLARAAAVVGTDVAGNALLAAPSTVASNLIAKATYDPSRDPTEGVGRAMVEGGAQGLAFAPGSLGHANHAAETNRRQTRLSEVIGPDHPAALAESPGGRDGVAMDAIAQGATGKPAVWFNSESPRNAFLDPKDNRIYVNANAPKQALEEAGHALFRGDIKPQVKSFIADNPTPVGLAADNYADRAENLGERAIADKVRENPEVREDEGFANLLKASMTPEDINNAARLNPGAFMRGYERVLGVIDSVAGTNMAKGRLVRRQLAQFMEPLERGKEVATAALSDENKSRLAERVLNAQEEVRPPSSSEVEAPVAVSGSEPPVAASAVQAPRLEPSEALPKSQPSKELTTNVPPSPILEKDAAPAPSQTQGRAGEDAGQLAKDQGAKVVTSPAPQPVESAAGKGAEASPALRVDQIGKTVGAMGGGIVDSMYDRMWDDVIGGKINTAKAGLSEQIAARGYRDGLIKSKEDLRQFVNDGVKAGDAAVARGEQASKGVSEWYAQQKAGSESQGKDVKDILTPANSAIPENRKEAEVRGPLEAQKSPEIIRDSITDRPDATKNEGSATEKPRPVSVAQASPSGPVSVEPLLDRYVIVKGTPKHPESIFARHNMGGSWDAKREGYVFTKSRRAEVQEAVDTTNRQLAAEGNKPVAEPAEKPPLGKSDITLSKSPDDDIPFGHGEPKRRPVVTKPAEPETKAPEEETEEAKTATATKPLMSRVATGAKALYQAASDHLGIDPLPKTTRVAPEAADKLVEHANARIAVPKMVEDLISKVDPQGYKDPKNINAAYDVMVKDNILGGYDQAKKGGEKLLSQARDADEAYAAAREKRQWLTDPAAKQANTDEIRKQRALGTDLHRQAKASLERADAIAEKHDIPAYEQQAQAAKDDPKLSGIIERWKEHVEPLGDQLFNEMKAVDPQTERDGRGKHFGARVNLVSKTEAAKWMEAIGDEEKPLPGPASSNYRNPNAKKDSFDQRASFTGDYTDDAKIGLTAMLGKRWNEVTKLRSYDALEKSGAAIRSDHIPEGQEPPEKIQGQDVARLPIKVPETGEDGSTRMVEKTLYLRQDLVREARDALDTDQRMPQSKLAKLLTSAQLLQASDAITHFKNMGSVVARAMGTDRAWKDAVRKMPVLGTGDAVKRLWQARNEIAADTPAIRAEIAQMAKEGNIRADYPAGGIQKFTKVSDFLHMADTAARVVMNRFHGDLVERGLAQDTPKSRRQFINQLGQYNARLQGPWMRALKQMGIAPFVVAGRNFTRQGVRSITGNPGFDATTPRAATKARAMTWLGFAMAATVPAMLNMVSTGTPSGRSGTPLGAWDLGTDEEDGKHKVVDLMQLSGIRRGLRATGLDAAIEGARQGKDANQIIGQGIEDVGQSQLHPWMGPAPAFAFKALTGRQLDMRGKMEAQQIPGGGAMQYVENARAALESQNPFLYAAARPAFKAAGLDQKPADEDSSYLGQIASAVGKSANQAAGVKDVYPGRDSAEELADRLAKAKFGDGAPSPDDAARIAMSRQLLGKLKSDPDAGQAAIEKAVEDGKLSERQAANLHKKAGVSALAWNVKSLSAEDAAKVYASATDEEKSQLEAEVTSKLAKSSSLSADKQDALFEELGIDPPEDLAMQRELGELSVKNKAYNDARKAAEGGDRAARAKLSSLRMSGRDSARLSRLQNIHREVTKARKIGGVEGARRVKRLVAAA